MIVGLALSVLVGASAAGAVIEARVVPRGQAVTFAGDQVGWYCFNGAAISCSSGDAEPYATLSKSGIIVRVVSLKRGCVKRVLRPSPDPSDPQMKPYYEYTYTFKAIGGC
jgi:hypothetical protein